MPQGIFKFRDSVTGKSYQMPWSNPTPPTDDEIDDFVKSQETPKVPTAVTPLSPVQEVKEPSLWDKLSQPLTTAPSKIANRISEYIDPTDPIKGRSTGGLRGVTSAYIESLGNTLSDLTSPVNLGMTALTGGAGAARGAVARGARNLIPVAKVLRGTEAAASAGMGAKGVYDISQDPTNVGGYLETGLGALGAKGAMKEIKAPNPRIRAVSEPLSKTEPIDTGGVKPVSGMGAPPKPGLTPEQELINALSQARRIRKGQEELYSQERAKRFAEAKKVGETTSGQEGFKQELSALGGELPKAQFTPIQVKPESIDYLFDKVKNSPNLNQNTFEPIRARVALQKLLGESGGTVPQANELELLNRVFGEDFISKVQRLRPVGAQAKTIVAKVLGTAKAARATLDLSFPLRQGIFYVGNKNFWKAMSPMIKDAFNAESFEARQQALKMRPNAGLAQRAGLDLTDLHTNTEEQFVNNYLENIPGIKHLVKGSNRAYVSFGNQIRAGVFDGMIENLQKSGKGVTADEAAAIAKYINTTTGRGGLGSLEKIGGELNTAVFSPRLASSRLQMVFRPSIYVKGSPEIRKQSLKSLLSLTGFMGSALGLAKMGGAEVSLNPNDADFGKIKVGNVRVDIGGGLLQPLRLASQLYSGKYVSRGQERNLGDTYVAPTRLSLLANYGVNKASPIGSFILDILRGKTNIGEPITPGGEVENLFVPMIIQDFKDLMKEDPSLIPWGLPAIFGAGVQVYPDRSNSRQRNELRPVSRIR